MSTDPQGGEIEEASDMFWCCLYAVERAGKHTFVYGYAVSAQEPASQWASSLVSDCAAWRLNRINCFLSATDLAAFTDQLLTGRLQLSTKKGQIEIDATGLRRRPSVYAIPRTLISSGSPQSFSDEPAVVDACWCVSKKGLIERAFPENSFAPDQLREATRTLFRQLQSETGISLLSDEAGRFGNFEIVCYLSGDIRVSDGLRYLNSPSDQSLVVWIEPPLNGKSDLSVNCRLFNGGGLQGRTCILDELKLWTPGTPLRFSPSEPYSEFELSVWWNGEIVAYQHQSVIRSIRSNMTIAGPGRRNITKWSRGFQGKLRERAEAGHTDVIQQIVARSPHDDSWRESEREARAIVESWFPQGANGRFFINAQASTLEAVEFIADLIRRPDVIRVTVVDPFFDRIGVESLLMRLGNVKEIKVLTSHVLGGGGTGYGTIDLAAACETGRPSLPPKLEVINIQSPGGTAQQFHDRYVVIEIGSEEQVSVQEVWMLSNSLSSFAIRYPLVIVPLAQNVANQVADYVQSLDNRQLGAGSSIQARVVWSNHRAQIPHVAVPISRLTREFPGSMLILSVLVPGSLPDAERAKAAVANGLLSENLPEIDWHVPSEATQQVVRLVKAALTAQTVDRDALLTAISHWAYHGGPPATEYGFDTSEIGLIRDALERHLTTQAQTNRLTYEFLPLRDAVALPESLEHVWYLLNQARLDARNGATPELFFFAEALWAAAPQILVHLLDTTGSFALLCWLATEGRTSNEGAAQSLIGSQLGAVQALGVLFLRDIAEQEATANGNDRLNVLAAKLMQSALPPLERLLAMIFISARYTRPGVSEPSPFGACAGMWSSQPLSGDERMRIAALVDRAAPNRAIPMISALAEECPLPTDASGFRQWCLDQIKTLFPLKLAISPQAGIRIVADELTLSNAAVAAWHIHGGETARWFCEEIIKKVNLWAALEPLLRVRDFSGWSKALEGVLLSMSFGLSLANSASSGQLREEFLRSVAPDVAKALVRLGPEVWQHFGDYHSRLANVVAFLGQSSDLLGDGNIEEIDRLVGDLCVPSVWRLLFILQSPTLARKYGAQALAMATNPTTPACCHGLSGIEAWTDRIDAAAGVLLEAHSDLRENLGQVRHEIRRWRDGLLPPPTASIPSAQQS